MFLHTYGDMTDTSSVDFLRRLKLASPIKISKILTDNAMPMVDPAALCTGAACARCVVTKAKHDCGQGTRNRAVERDNG
jgi:hypothetical protein